MNLNDLLAAEKVDPRQVLLFRHCPREPRLRTALPWLAAEKPEIFNAYQQTHGEKVEKAMLGASFVASFIGHEPGRALFVGLYSIGESRPLTHDEYWSKPAYKEMKNLGMKGFNGDRSSILWFDLHETELYSSWKGKLIIGWPGPERSWWRRAHKNTVPVLAIREESALTAQMPEWNELVLRWDELGLLPALWRNALSHWRGVYYIFDASDGKGYVGSAAGRQNILGRWENYANSRDGGNKLLRNRDPKNFEFSILERVSPDMDPSEVIHIEASWKKRLHSRSPFGLNDN